MLLGNMDCLVCWYGDSILNGVSKIKNRLTEIAPALRSVEKLKKEVAGDLAQRRTVMGIFGQLFGKKNKRNDTMEKICKVVDSFMTASMLLVSHDNLNSKPENKLKVLAYNFGAIDCLCQANNLDETETMAVTVIFLKNYRDMSSDEAGQTARLMMEISQEPEGIAFKRVEIRSKSGLEMRTNMHPCGCWNC